MKTLTDQPRHPREVRERMEVEAEVVILITGADALLRLTRDCRFPEAKARRLLNIAWKFGQKAEPCPGGYVHIWYHGKDDTKQHIFSVVEHIGEKQPRKVARAKEPRYTQEREPKPSRNTGTAETRSKGNTMPPRKGSTRTRQAAPEPETAAANGEVVDYQKYVDKPFSPTMLDYIEWFEANVANLDKLEVDKILVLGVSMYSHFQKSDFNIERREDRKAEREQTRASEPESEPEPAPATRARRGAAKPATARSAPRSARSAGKAPAGKPARARGRAAAAADADGGDAPF
jgi:hypothetical protein